MTADSGQEIIIVRSLTDSDFGLFASHRAYATSKQRAIQINAPVARVLLSPEVYERRQGVEVDCLCVFGEIRIHQARHIGKSHKNWRLGGHKIEGEAFSRLDSKDFVLIRSIAGNDGSSPILMTFIGKQTDRVVHAGIVAIIGADLRGSMVFYWDDEPGFKALDRYCPADLLSGRSGAGKTRRSTPRQGSLW